MSSFSSRENLLKTLGKYRKEIIFIEDGEEYKIILTYPKLKNSIHFWDTVYAITNLYDKTREDQELSIVESMKASKELLDPLSNYVFGCIENEENRQLSDEEKEIVYILLMKNYQSIVTEFSNLFGALFKGDDSKKSQVEVSQIE